MKLYMVRRQRSVRTLAGSRVLLEPGERFVLLGRTFRIAAPHSSFYERGTGALLLTSRGAVLDITPIDDWDALSWYEITS